MGTPKRNAHAMESGCNHKLENVTSTTEAEFDRTEGPASGPVRIIRRNARGRILPVMIAVFWLEHGVTDPAPRPHVQLFPPNDLSAALSCAEQLRARRAAGEPLSHVSIQSELPQSVGRAGVSDPPADYAHYKRRIDPAIPLGRPSGQPPGEEGELNRP